MSIPAEPRSVRVAIIGSGPAGWTAAIYAARALLKPVVIAGLQPGGQLTITTDVENYPGFADVIQGPWLMEQMRKQAEHVGTEVIQDIVTRADLSQRPFRLTLDSGPEILAETVIISTGAQAKWLGIESEQAYRGFGVSACATCDGFFYRGKNVIVVGGGNTAVEEALFLTNFAAKVTLVHRRDELRAERILQDRLLSNPKVEVIWDSAMDEGLGVGRQAASGCGGARPSQPVRPASKVWRAAVIAIRCASARATSPRTGASTSRTARQSSGAADKPGGNISVPSCRTIGTSRPRSG